LYQLIRKMREERDSFAGPPSHASLEDYASVLVVMLLGHRWPREIESSERRKEWIDRGTDIVALTDGPGEARLLARIRDRLAEDFR